MPGISGQGTTYNLPNFVGELHAISPEDTPFLSAIGGLTGGVETNSPLFGWQSYDLRDPENDRQRSEGADAPAAEGRSRVGAHNVVEIHQETVEVSYTKLAATGQTATSQFPSGDYALGTQPVQDEMTFQLSAALKQVARDVEKTFIVGQYNYPASHSPSDVRQTRGLMQAIATNTGTVETLTEDAVLDLFQAVWTNGGIQESETRTVIVNAALKRALTKIFIKDAGYKEQTRSVGGVNLQTFETDFGRANIMLDRWMPADQLAVVSLEECKPRYLAIPGKGHFFAEPLAKTGSADKVQLYGEIGLEYGNERKHGKLTVGADESSSSGDESSSSSG